MNAYKSKNDEFRFVVTKTVVETKPKTPIAEITIIFDSFLLLRFSADILFDRSTNIIPAEIQNIGNKGTIWKLRTKPEASKKTNMGTNQSKGNASFLVTVEYAIPAKPNI